jgi:hypothetical protein
MAIIDQYIYPMQLILRQVQFCIDLVLYLNASLLFTAILCYNLLRCAPLQNVKLIDVDFFLPTQVSLIGKKFVHLMQECELSFF